MCGFLVLRYECTSGKIGKTALGELLGTNKAQETTAVRIYDIPPRGTRYMTPSEVRTTLSLANDLRVERIDLPPEIQDVYRRIEEAKANALASIVHFRGVDMSLVYHVVMFEKDQLYAEWASTEAKRVV